MARLIARLTILAATLLAGLAPAAAGGFEMLPVASVTIYPGDLISEALLSEARFAPGTSAAYPVAVTAEELAGKVARRTLLPGKLIARNAVAEPQLVQKGTIVTAIYQDAELVITASVLALQSGALTETIQVRNIDSGKVIVGTVQADGSVRVGG